MKSLSKHLPHYLPLLGILLLGFLGFVSFSYDKEFQAALVISTAVGYLSWGLVHHYIHKDLHTSVIVEYLAIATLGVVVAFSIIFRG